MSIFKKKHVITVANADDMNVVDHWITNVGAQFWYAIHKKNGEIDIHIEATKKQWKKLVEVNAMNAKLMDKFMFTEIEA